ncbi:hypothetical protein COO03_04715 [Bacillus sp. AFS098217]|uniref:hypothetical protein n=1 Tax=Bacillus sp. AFS098217 TaxID=2033868 RepID=UPI000BEDF6CB|nr:hypothetical protein [Bacillus sp. AFS098217]PEB54548.1 hypothetical protein COO03_04715 [Bacillus sp. AFS098217]
MDSTMNNIHKTRILEHTTLLSLVHLIPMLMTNGIIYFLMNLSIQEWKTWLIYEFAFLLLFIVSRFQVIRTKHSISLMNHRESRISKTNIYLISIPVVIIAPLPAILKVAFILQMTVILYLLERTYVHIGRLPTHNLYKIKSIICDNMQLKIDRIIPNNEEHGTHSIKTNDNQYFLYTAVYLSGILSPISQKEFNEYERRNLMGR